MTNDGAVVVVDLCNTICDVNGLIEELFSVKRLPGVYRFDNLRPEFFRECPEIFSFPKAFERAADCLRMIQEQEHEIVYVTARPAEAEEVTLQYLRENNFPEGKVVFSSDKVSVCKDILKEKKLLFAMEDEPEKILSYKKANIPVLVKRWDYNIGMAQSFDWMMLYQYLKSGNNAEGFICS